MSGDDSVTDTDALKVLNTEIMAGTGRMFCCWMEFQRIPI